jgi:hypothetical protein
MKTFTNTIVTKAQAVASMKAHQSADQITQGVYWEDGKGCAVGCMIHDFRPGSENNHKLFPELFGIPEEIARLTDAIFEKLPNEDAKQFPLTFIEAIPEGADLGLVATRFKRFLLTEIVQFDREADPEVAAAVDGVIGLLDRQIAGDDPSGEERSAAESAAWSAAEYAAESAAESAAEYAARYATRYAAESAARAAAESAARAAAYLKMRDELLKLLAEAPVVEETK